MKNEHIKRIIASYPLDNNRDKTKVYNKDILIYIENYEFEDMFNTYIINVPFDKHWFTYVIAMAVEYFSNQKDHYYKIFNLIFNKFKIGEIIDDTELLGYIINNVTNIDTYVNRYMWLRKNIENGYIVTKNLTDMINDQLLKNELSLIHMTKKWNNDTFINKLYSSDIIIIKIFIDKYLTDKEKKQKFAELSETYFKKSNQEYRDELSLIEIYMYFMINFDEYYNDMFVTLYIFYIVSINRNKKILPENMSHIINNKLKKLNIMIDIHKSLEYVKKFCMKSNYSKIIFVVNIKYLNITNFKKLKINDIIDIFPIKKEDNNKNNNLVYNMKLILYIFDGELSDYDMCQILMIDGFTEILLEQIGPIILSKFNNVALSKMIFYDALQLNKITIIKYLLDNKYIVSNEDILNTPHRDILKLYSQYNIYMNKETFYKYYRKYIN